MVMLMQRLVPGAFAAATLAAMVSLAGCGPQPTYQVVQTPPPARIGTVESVREVDRLRHIISIRAKGPSSRRNGVNHVA